MDGVIVTPRIHAEGTMTAFGLGLAISSFQLHALGQWPLKCPGAPCLSDQYW